MTSPSVPGKWRAATIYTVLTLLLAYPISIRPDRIAWANDPDEHLVMWLLAWDTHAFLNHPLSIFDANTFYPEHRTLAYQENLIGSAFFAAPVLWLTGNPVLAANVVSLLACVLCGLGAYVLARRVGIGETGALLCGVIFAFSPPRFLRFPQTHLAVVQWIPFSLASLHAYLEGGRRRELLLATAFFTLQVVSSGHAGVFLVVAVLLMVAYRLALGEPILLKKRVRDFGVAGVLLLLPAVLFMIPYRINQVEMGLRRSLGSWDTPIESFFASPTRVDEFLQSLVTNRNINAAATAWLFPGVLPLGLALVAAVLGLAALTRVLLRPRPPEWKPIGDVKMAVYRRPLRWVLAGALVWALLSVARQALPAGTGLPGQYYTNANWNGPPAMSVVDREPSTAQMLERWTEQPPETYSVAWNGYLSILRPGLYFFATTSKDRSRLYIDNEMVVDNAGGQENGQAGSVRLDQGPHRVGLEYVHTDGRPTMKWEWVFDGDSDRAYKVVPQWALSRRPVGSTTVVVARIIETMRTVAAILVVFAGIWCVLAWPISRHETWVEWLAPYRRNPTAFYLLLTAVCVALAVGPPYGLWQYVYWLPGFNFIRGSSRFMVLGLLGIAILAGIGFERLTARLAPRARRVAAGVVVALMAAEFAAQPFSTPYTFEIPAADRWVAKQPKPFVVAEVPSAGGYERYETMYMLHSMAHWQKTVHGYGGIRPERHSVLYEELDTFPDTRSLQHLTDLDVTYIVVHIDLYPPEQWPSVNKRLRAFSERLNLEYSDPIGRVYALRRPQETTRAY